MIGYMILAAGSVEGPAFEISPLGSRRGFLLSFRSRRTGRLWRGGSSSAGDRRRLCLPVDRVGVEGLTRVSLRSPPRTELRSREAFAVPDGVAARRGTARPDPQSRSPAARSTPGDASSEREVPPQTSQYWTSGCAWMPAFWSRLCMGRLLWRFRNEQHLCHVSSSVSCLDIGCLTWSIAPTAGRLRPGRESARQ